MTTTRKDAARIAAARLAALTTAQVVEQWDHTDALMADYALPQDDRLAVIDVRAWLLDDLERRDPAALIAWIDAVCAADAGTDVSPAAFYLGGAK